MRRPAPISWMLTIVLCVLTIPVLMAAQVPTNRPLYPGEQWVRLFNGKDLTNWVEVGKEKWTVEDGTIHGQGVTNAYGYLRTEKKYKDFWFSLRFKCEADGNSGVYFHTEFAPGTANVSQGLQFEIDRTINHHNAGLYGDGRQWIAWPAPEYEPFLPPPTRLFEFRRGPRHPPRPSPYNPAVWWLSVRSISNCLPWLTSTVPGLNSVWK